MVLQLFIYDLMLQNTPQGSMMHPRHFVHFIHKRLTKHMLQEIFTAAQVSSYGHNVHAQSLTMDEVKQPLPPGFIKVKSPPFGFFPGIQTIMPVQHRNVVLQDSTSSQGGIVQESGNTFVENHARNETLESMESSKVIAHVSSVENNETFKESAKASALKKVDRDSAQTKPEAKSSLPSSKRRKVLPKHLLNTIASNIHSQIPSSWNVVQEPSNNLNDNVHHKEQTNIEALCKAEDKDSIDAEEKPDGEKDNLPTLCDFSATATKRNELKDFHVASDENSLADELPFSIWPVISDDKEVVDMSAPCSEKSGIALKKYKYRQAKLKKNLKEKDSSIIGRKQKRKWKNLDDNVEEDGVLKTKRPNYFVSIQITNPRIHHQIQKVQQAIIKDSPELKPALIPLPTLHLTVMVMHLAGQEDIDRASSALDDCLKKIQSYKEDPLQFSVVGLSNFRKAVLFADVEKSPALDSLQQVSDVVMKTFEAKDIPAGDSKGFTPHITLCKLSKLRKCKGHKPSKINVNSYQEYMNEKFGKQTMRNLQLCAMMKKKDEHGYYHVEHQVDLVPPNYSNKEPDDFEHVECSYPTDDIMAPAKTFVVEFGETLEWKTTKIDSETTTDKT